MQRLEQGFLSKARDMDFFAEFDTAKSLGRFIQLLHQKNYNVTDMQLDKREYKKAGISERSFTSKWTKPPPTPK